MPSTQTRTKLKKFQFIDGAPAVPASKAPAAEKENILEASKLKAAKDVAGAQKTTETPKLAQSKLCPPSTPAARLPLAELVGNIDDSSRPIMKPIVSPEEQLCWRGSQPINTPLPRKRKRARSSSPAAPSQEEPRPPESARKELTTPQADPAQELWNRYTNNKGTPSGNKGVAFAHLINESSPRSSATAGSVSGLRRWASCGVEFPASTRKRRRVHGAMGEHKEQTEDVFGHPSSDGMFQGQPQETSKLAGMLQRMRESISKPPSRMSSQIPSSSSPLPEPERHVPGADSPLQHRGREQSHGTNDTSETLPGDVGVAEGDEVVDIARSFSGSSDDFGDIDFDTEMVDALEMSTKAPEPPGPHLPQTAHPVNPASNPPSPAPQRIPPAISTDSDDEFGFDEDIFAADLEQVASLYDTRPNESSQEQLQLQSGLGNQDGSATAAAAPPVINLVDDDDEDDFGDDIDVDEFAAAEIAATQAPATTVRKSHAYS